MTACNDGARKMDRTEQLHEIHKKLDFGKLKPFPIVSVSRQLERRGTVVRLQVEQKLLGKAKIKKKELYLFVFTDYVMITKRKKEYVCVFLCINPLPRVRRGFVCTNIWCNHRSNH